MIKGSSSSERECDRLSYVIDRCFPLSRIDCTYLILLPCNRLRQSHRNRIVHRQQGLGSPEALTYLLLSIFYFWTTYIE